jgi:pSer/pThr/pTyr-binding forkhead associated (FHA) protein
LYTQTATPPTTKFSRALTKERILVLHCVESSTENQAGTTYYVGQAGAEGGRTRATDALSRSYVQLLDDPTVSRRHFRIYFEAADSTFHISDLGSVSGVLVRIPHSSGVVRVGHTLRERDTICVGKHHLAVEDLGQETVRLRCVAPAGSPIEEQSFTIGRGGALLGRAPDSAVPFTALKDGKLLGIDKAVSTSQCRIAAVQTLDRTDFIVSDGGEKPSRNGTWLLNRNGTWPLEEGTELVIGNSRFTVQLGTTIVEHQL